MIRLVIILVLTFLDLSFAAPDVVRPVLPLGDLGFSAVTNAVSSVVPNRPAARAHLQAGDLLAFASSEDRFRFYDPSSVSFVLPHPGARASFDTERGGTTRHVTLTADPFAQTPNWLAPLRVLVEAFWIVLAALLVWQRPSILTWSFFFFSLFKKVAPIALAPLLFPVGLVVIHHVAFEVFAAISQSAAIVFILSLGRPPLPRWHTIAAFVLAPLFVILNLPSIISNLLWYLQAIPHSVFDFSNSAAYGIISPLWAVVALVLLGAIYAENKGQDRQQVAWVFVGFAIYSIAHAAVGLLPSNTALGVYALLWTAYGILPLCVAYAILKYRLIDVSFYVSRGLAYGAVSSLVIGSFALIDWFFSKELSDQRIGTFAEIVAAIALGLSINTINKRIDETIERLLFHRKHQADEHLRHLRWNAPQVSHEVIRNNLVDEPMTALDLASAALFEHADRGFKLVHSCGWTNSTMQSLRTDDLLALRSNSERTAYVLDELLMRDHALPKGSAKPDVALPIFVRNELTALAFYSGHKHGEHLDADEIRILNTLAAGASTGYAQLEASRLEAQVEFAQNETRHAVAEAQILQLENQQLRESIAVTRPD